MDEAVRSGRPIMLLGMHYGAIELPVLFVFGMVGHRVTAPMETVGDPALQRWFETTRSRVGVNIVPLRGARLALLAAARRGESIGMVNDRDLTGTGIPVPFFGAPAPRGLLGGTANRCRRRSSSSSGVGSGVRSTYSARASARGMCVAAIATTSTSSTGTSR